MKLGQESGKEPWDTCRVAFSTVAREEIWEYLSSIDGKWKDKLPEGWLLCETDGSCFQVYSVFEVDGIPSAHDGQQVKELLKKVDAIAKRRHDREVKLAPNYCG